MIFGIVLFFTIPVQAVKCPTCHDQLAGCQGGDKCPFLATTSENAGLIAGTVTAGYLTVQALLPQEWRSVFKKGVLDFFLVVARRPATGAAVDCSKFSVADLMEAHKNQSAPKADILSALLSRAGESSEAGEQSQITNIINIIKMESSTLGSAANARVGECIGSLQLLWARLPPSGLRRRRSRFVRGRRALRRSTSLTIPLMEPLACASCQRASPSSARTSRGSSTSS